MDPIANRNEQVNTARYILHNGECETWTEAFKADCLRLAELVVALDEWRRAGGFDPYQPTAPTATT